MSALLLKPARVWTDGAMHDGWSVLVRGNRIAAVGPGIDAGDAQVIDLKGLTLLPGLMDLHSHLFLHPYNEASWDDQVLHEPLALRTARAVVDSGITGWLRCSPCCWADGSNRLRRRRRGFRPRRKSTPSLKSFPTSPGFRCAGNCRSSRSRVWT